MQLAAAREENQSVTRKLKAQEKELQMRREHLNKRAENVKKDQEKLRQFKLENEETLKKNEARRLCAIERIKENKAKIKVTEEDIKKLKERYEALLARKELLELQVKQHQESTAKMPGKIEDTGRDSDCGGMQSIREEILEKWDNEEKEAESKKLEEIKRDELRSATEREALQCAQIKARIHSIYELIAPYWRVSVNIKDPYRQLELLGESGEVVAVVDVEPAVVELMDSVVLYIGHVSSILDGGTETFVHSLQPVTCTTPVKTTQKNDNVQNQGAWEESL
ncbi:Laminin subunit beta-4 [Labeo rohita]|uniref:Laminin subunit beta-4 n=1 Tax=Labeo rohita TaxID=84645 RepID=A0ABQ8M8I0_LABRO|nr:Laminin subunit beta-4 [Labeo rohita]